MARLVVRDRGPAQPAVMNDEELTARLLYRDGMMLVIDKPAGIAVHRGPKGGTCLEDYFDALRFGLPRKPALVHRLDRDTSGCLVLGRHHQALEKLGLLFKQGKVQKTYWGIVAGGPSEDEGLIDLPLKRLDPTRGWWMKADSSGLPSQTSWRVLSRKENFALLELTPFTGRTHQLRVHCAAAGWPILGDSIYGHGGPIGLQLHARAITIPLYKNKEPVMVEAPVPPHMREALERFSLPDTLPGRYQFPI